MSKESESALIGPAVEVDQPEELALFGLLRSLEAALMQESKKSERLTPFLQEIYTHLNAGNFAAALPFLDELEEFMDLEFCEKKPKNYL